MTTIKMTTPYGENIELNSVEELIEYQYKQILHAQNNIELLDLPKNIALILKGSGLLKISQLYQWLLLEKLVDVPGIGACTLARIKDSFAKYCACCKVRDEESVKAQKTLGHKIAIDSNYVLVRASR